MHKPPLDGHPVEANSNLWIVRVHFIATNEYKFLYDPAVPSFEKAAGSAYRYSDTSLGRSAVLADAQMVQKYFKKFGTNVYVNVVTYHGAYNAERNADKFSQTI